MNITANPFGYTNDVEEVLEFILSNNNGVSINILTFGAAIRKIVVPDRTGKKCNIVLGYDNVEGYESNPPYLGVAVGRYAGRISNASFDLDGKKIILVPNNGTNFIHGGAKGISKLNWKVRSQEIEENCVSVVLACISEDNEEGLPGKVDFKIKYSLNDQNEFIIEYEATTDKATPINLTNHTYFNLNKGFDKDISNHQLKMDADTFIELGKDMIGTAETSVDDTPFDFRRSRYISEGFDSDNPQIRLVNGYDHVFRLNKSKNNKSQIHLSSDDSGIEMSVKTDSEAMVLYTSNMMDGSLELSDGYKSRNHLGICFETQYFPNDLNSDFIETKTIIRPGEKYTQTTVWTFSTQK